MVYDLEKCGGRIRRLRKKADLTQEMAATALNIDQSFYGRIEAGKKGCSVDLFIQLSEFFEVSLDYLILGRYCDILPKAADKTQLRLDIGELIDQLERFRSSL